jgi:hypothetical protein
MAAVAVQCLDLGGKRAGEPAQRARGAVVPGDVVRIREVMGTPHRHHMNRNHLRHQHGLDGIPRHSVEMTASQLASMMKEKRCVLILNGFDEIKSYASRDDRMSAFSKLLPIMSLASICCMSCRPAHFLGLDDLRSSILMLNDRSYGRKLVSAGSTKFGATANKNCANPAFAMC